jgi:quinol-cytochrome oxidoreductase complex cytochrome b subunit
MKKLALREAFLKLLFMFLAVLVFTFFDWLVHSSSNYLAVPPWYFKNKIIYATIYAFLISLFVRKKTIAKQAAWISGITVVLLQIRYALYGYPLYFHFVILTEHAIFLYLSSFFALKILARLSNPASKR